MTVIDTVLALCAAARREAAAEASATVAAMTPEQRRLALGDEEAWLADYDTRSERAQRAYRRRTRTLAPSEW